ncbi:MAG: hypothetical protein HY819_23210 [Acidobacteria bacterium]|nr:hypothetical protein [Acidobacteriota bacterium]
MSSQKKSSEIITSHSILTGLTPIIPIPFADDLAKSYFQERLVRKLAESYGQSLSNEDLKILAREEKKGCLPGCLTTILFYPIKKLFRKIFFFLEWKRAIDTVSRSYHRGYLLEYSLEEKMLKPKGLYSADEIKNAIEATCLEVGTNPIEKAVKATFDRSKEAVKDVAETLLKSISQIRGNPSDEDLQKAVQNAESAETRTGVNAQLEQALVTISPDYFQHLKERFLFYLKNPKTN